MALNSFYRFVVFENNVEKGLAYSYYFAHIIVSKYDIWSCLH